MCVIYKAIPYLILILIIIFLPLTAYPQQILKSSEDEILIDDLYYAKSDPSEEGILASSSISRYYFRKFSKDKKININQSDREKIIVLKTYFYIDCAEPVKEGLCLFMHFINYSMNVYVNGNLIYKTNQKPYIHMDYNPPHLIYIPEQRLNHKSIPNDLTIEFFNLPEDQSQVHIPDIKLSNFTRVSWHVFWKDFFSRIYVRGVSFTSLVLFLYFLFLFMTRHFMDMRYIYFSLICLFFSLSFLTVTFYQTPDNELILMKISRISLPLTMYLSFLFILEQTKLFRKTYIPELVVSILALITTTLLLIQPKVKYILQIYYIFLNTIMLPILLTIIGLLIFSMFKKKKKKKGEFIILIGFLIASLTAGIDIFEYNIFFDNIYFVPFGFSILLICIFFVLALEQSQALRDKEDAQKKLDQLSFNIHNSLKNKLESAKHLMEYYIKSTDKPLQDLNFIKKLIDNSSKESKNILFVLKNSECDIKTMNQELEMRADLSLSPVKIEYQLNKNRDDDKTILSSENIQCILGIFSELLTNIVKHSEADFVKIDIHYDNDFIEFSVEDNGIGFDISKTKNKYGSYGLSIIEDILDKDCCKFKISSKPGIGTKAIIRICNPYL